jgi:hypothetical protein
MVYIVSVAELLLFDTVPAPVGKNDACDSNFYKLAYTVQNFKTDTYLCGSASSKESDAAPAPQHSKEYIARRGSGSALPESLEEGGVDGDNVLGEHAHHGIVVLRLTPHQSLSSPAPKTSKKEYYKTTNHSTVVLSIACPQFLPSAAPKNIGERVLLNNKPGPHPPPVPPLVPCY